MLPLPKRFSAKKTQMCASPVVVSKPPVPSLTSRHSGFKKDPYAHDFVFIVIRDVRDRGRDVEGIIKQWLAFVKPNFVKASHS